MTPPSTTPTELTADVRPSPLVRRTFGEARFHTDGDVSAVGFSDDGSLWSIDESGVLRKWALDGKLLKRSYLSDLETLWCFGPGAKLLASGNDDLLLWDVTEGNLIRRFEQQVWVTALAFSPDGAILASGHDDGTVQFWDLGSQQSVGRVAAHPSAVSAISFAPGGRFVATVGEDRVVRVWDAASHKTVAELVSHTDRVPALSWSSEGRWLASAGWDTSARVWEVGDPDPLILLNSHADQVLTLAFSPAGPVLATADSDHEIHLWADPLTAKVGHVLRGHTDEVRCLAFSADGALLASGGSDRVVRVWDTATGQPVGGAVNPAGHALAVARAGGRSLLASTAAPTFKLYDTATGAEVAPSGFGPAVSVASAGNWLAVGGVDAVTRLFDLNDLTATPKLLEATKPPIGPLAFAPSGSLLAQASPADGLVWLWVPHTGEPRLILIEAADGCTLEGLAVHPDGRRVAVGGVDYLSTGERDGAVCIWDAETKEKLLNLDFGVYDLAFDPSGRYLAGAGLTDHVYVWDLATGDLLFELEGHSDRVNAVAFSPDGSYLVSGSDDLTVRVWDVLSGRLFVAREFDSPVQALAFSPDGQTLFAGNENTTCSQVEFQQLLDD